MSLTTRVEAAFWYGCIVLILLSAALYNGFPLVTSDTGAYINSGFHLEVPRDRPIVYGLFLRLTSLRFSLWLVIGAQAALLAAVLLRATRVLMPAINAPGIRVAVILLSTWATGAAWFSGQLMPDIFTAIGLLTILLFYFDAHLKRWQLPWLALLLLLCTVMHSSNLLTFSLVAMLVIGLKAVRRQMQALAWRRLATVAGIVLIGWLVLPSVHWAFGGGFAVSRSSYMFLMGRLVESGILDKYLADHCDAGGFPELCKYRTELPNDAITFLWDSQSVPNRTGGWEVHQAEYSYIIRDVLTSPRYYPALLSEAVQATLRQIVSVELGDGLSAHRDNTNPFWKVQESFPYELREYLSSRQNQSKLEFASINSRNEASLLLTVGLLCVGLGTVFRRRLPAEQRLWLLVCLLGVVTNAGVTGGLANVLSRLQTRVVWILPFSVLCLVVSYLLAAKARFTLGHAPTPKD
ncbi:hypothetical protein [Hymenobacter sp. APR13]|uniref:hypothetical protein n=1 Tax=Hymenobacter sp. APR13 TaxID=1356852 RepID=UPI0004E07DF3|nr:hypothetical protein [Hymenobacter sp. APR13]AII51812.1 hypothetical protein N008_07420 [Hymenobacter sp. APR13]